jgi:hypothetical protein
VKAFVVLEDTLRPGAGLLRHAGQARPAIDASLGVGVRAALSMSGRTGLPPLRQRKPSKQTPLRARIEVGRVRVRGGGLLTEGRARDQRELLGVARPGGLKGPRSAVEARPAASQPSSSGICRCEIA